MTAVVDVPAQIACVDKAGFTLGTGWMFTLNIDAGPEQPFAVGVIEYCTVARSFPIFVRLSVMLPFPKAEFPLAVPVVTMEDHVKVVHVTPDDRVTFALAPEQIVLLEGEFETDGSGLTVIT